MAGLEQRLLDTELALFESLTSSRQQGADQHASPSVAGAFKVHNTTTSKAAKMAEWADLPLASTQDREHWRQSKAASIDRAPATVEHQWRSSQNPPRTQIRHLRTTASSSLDETAGSFPHHDTGGVIVIADAPATDLISSAGSCRAAYLERQQSRRFF
jgi:hypothetical protein